MSDKTDIHPIQSAILCKLLFVNQASFTELNISRYGSDQFSFHLRELGNWGLIEKNSDGKYQLTTKGKEYANRFDTETKEVERQPKIAVLVIAIKVTGRKREYLIQQRTKQPYYGYWGNITGKIRWDETVSQAAKRELFEESGLKGEVELIQVAHKMDYSVEGKILEDKYFLVNRVVNPEGNLIEVFEGGINQWMTKKEIFKLDKLFDGVKERIELVEKGGGWFSENKFEVKGY